MEWKVVRLNVQSFTLTMCLSTWLEICLQYCGLKTEFAVEIWILLTSLMSFFTEYANLLQTLSQFELQVDLNLWILDWSDFCTVSTVNLNCSKVCVSAVCVMTTVMLGGSVPSGHIEAQTIQQGINVSSTSNRALRQLPQATLWNRQVDGRARVCLNYILDTNALLPALYLTWRVF